MRPEPMEESGWCCLLRLLLISLLFCIHSRSPLHFLLLFSNTAVEDGLHRDTRGPRQQGTCQRVLCWNTSLRVRTDWAPGGGGGRRWLLFERLVSVWRCPRGCGACYPWEGKKKQDSDGATCLFFKPTHTHAWMGSAHLHILHQKHWGRIIRTLVAIR